MMELSGLEPPTFPAAIKSPLIGRAGTGPDLRVATQEVATLLRVASFGD